LSPEERERARRVLRPEVFSAYAAVREGSQSVTFLARRAGVSPRVIRNRVRAAQLALGYEPTYAARKPQPGAHHPTAAQEREATAASFWFLVGELPGGWDELREVAAGLPRRTREEIHRCLEEAATEAERDVITARFLRGPVLERLRRHGLYLNSDDDGDDDGYDDQDAARHRGDDGSRLLEEHLGRSDLALPDAWPDG
jgi:hypothetical protein